MTFNPHSARHIRCLAASAAAVALAAPSASAAPVAQVPRSSSGCETEGVAKYRVPARVPPPSWCEEQVLASRGSGAAAKPTEADTFPGLAAAAREVPRVESSDSGFDWASAAVGAAVVACVLALAWLAAIAASRRLRAAR